MKEIWKNIKDYEGLYQVSNLGNVKSLKTNKCLYYSKSKNYLRVGLNKNGIRRGYSIHRLVAQTFIPNPDNLPCINHKDCNGHNNKVDNLEWCTYKYNNSYKNHYLKKNISATIYYLKRDYPNEQEIIELAEKLKDKINNL